jgi:hypothetical protein
MLPLAVCDRQGGRHGEADIGDRERLGDGVVSQRVEAMGSLAPIGVAVIIRMTRSG